MTATQSRTRVSPFFDAPAKTFRQLPTTPAGRAAVLSDGVCATILTLQGLLASDDPAVILKAAGMILDLAKTSLRHNRDVSGTSLTASCESRSGQPEPMADLEDSVQPPTVEDPEDGGDGNLADPFIQYVRKLRQRLQDKADATGTGEVVTWADAEALARWQIKRIRDREANTSQSNATPHGRDAPGGTRGQPPPPTPR